MDAGVSKQDLLYVSDSNGEVTVYRYWQHTLVGTLTSVTQPMGECADSSSNVYVTDYTTKKIFEFAHGGTKPLRKLDDSPDSPYACSVDPTTRSLAVANNDGSNEGNIAIWAKGSGTPKIYKDSQVSNFIGCAYDNNGSLLGTDGQAFAWLPKGGTALVNIRVPGPNPSWKWGVQGVQFDGKFFALDEYEVYRIALTHGQAYYAGMTNLYWDPGSSPSGPYAFYNNKPGAQATEIVGGDVYFSDSAVYYFDYPAGGSSLYQLTHGVDKPAGVTISLRTN